MQHFGVWRLLWFADSCKLGVLQSISGIAYIVARLCFNEIGGAYAVSHYGYGSSTYATSEQFSDRVKNVLEFTRLYRECSTVVVVL